MSLKPCPHDDLGVLMSVFHMQDGDDGPRVGSFVSLKVNCKACGQPFGVRGMIDTPGPSLTMPTCSNFGAEGRIPIEPLSENQVAALARMRFAATPGAGGSSH